jgi:hypothetical protein
MSHHLLPFFDGNRSTLTNTLPSIGINSRTPHVRHQRRAGGSNAGGQPANRSATTELTARPLDLLPLLPLDHNPDYNMSLQS